MKQLKYIYTVLLGLLASLFADDLPNQAPVIEAKAFGIEFFYQNPDEEDGYSGQGICLSLLLDEESGEVTLHVPGDLNFEAREVIFGKKRPDLSKIPLVLKDDSGKPFGRLYKVDCENKEPQSSIIYTLYFDALPPQGSKYIQLSGSIPVGVAGALKTTESKPLELKEEESVTFGDISLKVYKITPDRSLNITFRLFMENRDYKIENIEYRNAAGKSVRKPGSMWRGWSFWDLGCKLDRSTEADYTFSEIPESVDVVMKYRDIERVDVPVDVRFQTAPATQANKEGQR